MPAAASSDVSGVAARPLHGVVVLDLSRLLPGPYCTQLLVDLGAHVLRVEDPVAGDVMRHAPPLLSDGQAALFHAVNRGKRSIALDLKDPAGKAELLALVGRADVVVESFRPGVLERLGLSHATLRAANPRLVVCALTGFGQTGEHARRAGHDVNFVARAGAFALMAGPTVLPVQVADLAGGALPAALHIMAALLLRERTGAGCVLDVNLTAGTLALLTSSTARFAAGGAQADGGPDLLTGAAPCYGVYATADGHLALGAIEPKFSHPLCAALGLPDLADDALAVDARGAAARAAIAARLATRTTAQWLAVLGDLDVCVEPLPTLRDAFGAAAQSGVNHVVVDVDGAPVTLPAQGVGFPGCPPVARRAPQLGEDTDRVRALVAAGTDLRALWQDFPEGAA